MYLQLNTLTKKILAKRLTEFQIKEMTDDFINGKSIDQLLEKFSCTKLTIIRNLKKNLTENKYNYLLKENISQSNQNSPKKIKKIEKTKSKENEEDFLNADLDYPQRKYQNDDSSEYFSDPTFMEITPLDFNIDNETQKDLSSISISEINFPKVVYMIVDSKIELEIKLLSEYPNWKFLSQNELSRKTIEIYFDLKTAKKFCNKEQKVIKVPNTDVFRIVSPILLSRGISRIVSPDQLIAL